MFRNSDKNSLSQFISENKFNESETNIEVIGEFNWERLEENNSKHRPRKCRPKEAIFRLSNLDWRVKLITKLLPICMRWALLFTARTFVFVSYGCIKCTFFFLVSHSSIDRSRILRGRHLIGKSKPVCCVIVSVCQCRATRRHKWLKPGPDLINTTIRFIILKVTCSYLYLKPNKEALKITYGLGGKNLYATQESMFDCNWRSNNADTRRYFWGCLHNSLFLLTPYGIWPFYNITVDVQQIMRQLIVTFVVDEAEQCECWLMY